MNMEKVITYIENIAENLEGLIHVIGYNSMPSKEAVFIDGEQNVNCISADEAISYIDSFGNNCTSVMIGKSDFILIYDESRKLVIDGEGYLPSGYLVMKYCDGVQALDEEDIEKIISELRSKMTMIGIGKYRTQAYQLG